MFVPSERKVVRETVCRTILNRTSLGDYSLNCYTGCEHACVYCYARFMQRFHPHPEVWGEFVDVKVNAVEVLKRQLRRAKLGEVFVSSVCDGWQPVEREWGLEHHRQRPEPGHWSDGQVQRCHYDFIQCTGAAGHRELR